MHPNDLDFFTSCIYVPPLILLYLAEIWTILKPGSPYKSSFYILFVAGAIADLTMFGSTLYELRLVFFPLVNGFFEDYDCAACSQIRIALSFICPFTQDFLNCFVALNRLTSIRKPVQHNKIWKKLLPLAISFSFLFSIAIVGVSFFRKVTYVQVNMGDYVMYFATEDFSFQPWHNTHRITSIEIIITSVVIIFLYALAGRSLQKQTRTSAKIQQERKLLLFGIINFVIMCPLFFLQVLQDFKFFPSEWQIIILYQYTWLIDVKCFCSAVTMICVNTSFQKHMMKSLKLPRFSRSDSVYSLSRGSKLVLV